MLSASQIEAFHTQGFLVVEDVLDTECLKSVRLEYSQVLDRLYAGWQAEGRVGAPLSDSFWGKLLTAYEAGCDWFQPMDISLPGDQISPDTPMHFGPAVFDMVRAPRLLDIVEQLIGGEITSNPIQHVRIKPPARTLTDNESRAHITSTDWHQDRAVALDEADRTEMVTCWLAITDATVENGCLQVLPKAPAQEMLPHCPQRQTAIAPGYVAEEKAVPLPVAAGGMVLFHPLTPHASLMNKTDGFRWSFDLRFHVTGQPSGRNHFPDFIARSRAHPETELHDWQEWKKMWEEARARLSKSPHIAIHRWQSDSPACA
ncbi:phytanoyl-CoA dioxygenase family protein [Boseongicola aestuarii]|uniref:Phytanoyl-CoA dioxygenase (PhyH) n=1 Tax=Boseongicola aestuarii TaxID=1470561 RepID=A0A238IWH4_9RHOB|nr:phytanoyl-CoA dioxygenase family protein [Boseongicola aestuarii]SMX22839.1 Phytanoyl-CoA dioxygenase (PhyH) [Boseongicola aestuarii]